MRSRREMKDFDAVDLSDFATGPCVAEIHTLDERS